MPARPAAYKRKIKPIKIVPPPPGTNLHEVARNSRYVGSPYHRTIPTSAGQPIYRAGKSKCPAYLQRNPDRVQHWLREAILARRFGPFEGGFPGRVWHREGDTIFEARQGTPGSGQYHGFPLSRNPGIRGL